MEIKKTLYWFTAFVPLIISCFALLFLPQYIPSHFNFVGVIDAWSVKYNSFIISGSGLLLAMFFYLCAYAFERKITTSSDIKENINNQKILLGVGFAFDLLFVAGTIAFYAVAFKVTERTRMNATSLIGVIIGTLSIIFGLVVRLLGEKSDFRHKEKKERVKCDGAEKNQFTGRRVFRMLRRGDGSRFVHSFRILPVDSDYMRYCIRRNMFDYSLLFPQKATTQSF
jgi:uncharacterized membrane protein